MTPVRLACRADNLPELFHQAAHKLVAEIIDPAEVGEALREKLVVEAEDLSSLLRDWVNGLLSLVRRQHILCHEVTVQRLETTPAGPYRIQADVLGELWDPARHQLKLPAQSGCQESRVAHEGGVWIAGFELGELGGK